MSVCNQSDDTNPLLCKRRGSKKNIKKKEEKENHRDQITLSANDMKQGFGRAVLHPIMMRHYLILCRNTFVITNVPASAAGHVTSIPVSSSEECIMLIK